MKTQRRRFLRGLGAAGLALAARGQARPQHGVYDVLVIGAGVFGVWSAYHLRRAGKRVAVIDSFSPAHSGASSGGESRVTRCGYGDAALYSDWAWRSLAEWQALSDRAGLPVLHRLGVLWLHRVGEPLVTASSAALNDQNIPFEILDARSLRQRYPVMRVDDDQAGMLEPLAGGLMARRSVQALALELVDSGVPFLSGRVEPIRSGDGESAVLPHVNTEDGRRIEAEQFVFACGPWLDKVCPDAMAGRLFVTRQEVYYFATPAGLSGDLPVWADLPFYGLPGIEGRGFKVANDTHGPILDPDTADRRASEAGESAAREFLSQRFPSLASLPLSESRVCQYENSSSGDFVIDRHPGLDNAWLAGCGSGHGFKHGPAVGQHVAALLTGQADPIQRFALASKADQQQRAVQ